MNLRQRFVVVPVLTLLFRHPEILRTRFRWRVERLVWRFGGGVND